MPGDWSTGERTLIVTLSIAIVHFGCQSSQAWVRMSVCMCVCTHVQLCARINSGTHTTPCMMGDDRRKAGPPFSPTSESCAQIVFHLSPIINKRLNLIREKRKKNLKTIK